jgi:hypothetical protein
VKVVFVCCENQPCLKSATTATTAAATAVAATAATATATAADLAKEGIGADVADGGLQRVRLTGPPFLRLARPCRRSGRDDQNRR